MTIAAGKRRSEQIVAIGQLHAPLEKEPAEPVAGSEEHQDHERYANRDGAHHLEYRRTLLAQPSALPTL